MNVYTLARPLFWAAALWVGLALERLPQNFNFWQPLLDLCHFVDREVNHCPVGRDQKVF